MMKMIRCPDDPRYWGVYLNDKCLVRDTNKAFIEQKFTYWYTKINDIQPHNYETWNEE